MREKLRKGVTDKGKEGEKLTEGEIRGRENEV
jgi:hypothetical protein